MGRMRKTFLLLTAALVAACQSQPAYRVDGIPSVATQVPLPTVGINRGVIECPDDRRCLPHLPRKQIDPSKGSSSLLDIDLQFYLVGPKGKTLSLLASGADVASGELFTVFIGANRDAHVYLFHRDPRGHLTELVRASGQLGGDCRNANHIRAGETLQLPLPAGYYRMEGQYGVETLHAVVTKMPVCEADSIRWESRSEPLDCSVPSRACAKPFIIHHIKKL